VRELDEPKSQLYVKEERSREERAWLSIGHAKNDRVCVLHAIDCGREITCIALLTLQVSHAIVGGPLERLSVWLLRADPGY
jgi:hypothetical protein